MQLTCQALNNVIKLALAHRVLLVNTGGIVFMLLLLLLLVTVLAVMPAWPYSRGWGYYPSGGLGTILIILVVLMLLGYIHI